MKRREFINWVGLGALASSLPMAIAACQSPEEVTDSAATAIKEKLDTSPREDGFAAVGTVAELDENGFISAKSFVPDAVAVVRNPTDTAAVIAVGSLCTHQGCTVKWDAEPGLFACPCHGSTFNSDGTVATGPAEDPLKQFEAKIEGDLVLVQTKA